MKKRGTKAIRDCIAAGGTEAERMVYESFRDIIATGKKKKKTAVEIIERLKTEAWGWDETISYIERVAEYLQYGKLKAKDSGVEDNFYQLFLKDLETGGFVAGILLPELFLMFEGLDDLTTLDKYKPYTGIYATLEGIKIPLDNYSFPKEIYTYAQTDLTLFIVGETGTGKGLMARAIKKMSKRRDAEYRELHCAGVPDNLFESELLGHKKGAFTGAISDKKGLLAFVAKGGTLFIDEVGKIPEHLQVKLLKVIEDKEYYLIGSDKAVKIDVRFIAAAQPNEIEECKINPDLLYRLGYPNVIQMPTLNERLELMPKITIERILDRVARLAGLKVKNIPKDVHAKLVMHKYEGNFRELENILVGAFMTAEIHWRNYVSLEDISFPQTASEKWPDVDVSKIPLNEVFDYAAKQSSKFKNRVLKAKREEMIDKYGTLKAAYQSEGIKGTYTNFMNRISLKN